MADRVFLSNDSSGNAVTGAGIFDDEQTFMFAINETSVHGGAGMSAGTLGQFIAKQNGRIVDVFVGAAAIALSASGFVSGSVFAQVRVNSATVCATKPQINMKATSTVIPDYPNTIVGLATGVSAVLTAASANFSTGNMISLDWNTTSNGSAAAGQAGTGFYAGIRVRYAAL